VDVRELIEHIEGGTPRPGAKQSVGEAGPPVSEGDAVVTELPKARSEGGVTGRVLEILGELNSAALARDRSDLAAHLGEVESSLRAPFVPVVLLGSFKAGKSSLVNALLQSEVCPVDPDVATSAATIVRYGEALNAFVYTSAEQVGAPARTTGKEVPFSDLATYVTEVYSSESDPISSAEVFVPAEILKSGLVLVDSPGTGTLSPSTASAMLRGLPGTEAIIFVSDADREFDEQERMSLHGLAETTPSLICALTKCDVQVHWRDIRALDSDHLRSMGLTSLIVATAAPLRGMARTLDSSLDAESGVPELSRILDQEVVPRALDRAAQQAAFVVRGVLGDFRSMLVAAQSGLDPARQAASLDRLRTEAEGAERLAGVNARWRETIDVGGVDVEDGATMGIEDLIDDVASIVARTVVRAKEEVGRYIAKTELNLLQVEISFTVDEILFATIDREREQFSRLLQALGRCVEDEFKKEAAAAGARVGDLVSGGIEGQDGSLAPDIGGLRLSSPPKDGADSYRESVHRVLTGLGPLGPNAPAFVGDSVAERQSLAKPTKEDWQRAAEAFLDDRAPSIERAWRGELRSHQRQLRHVFGEKADDIDRSAREALNAAERAAASSSDSESEARRNQLSANLAQLERLEHQLNEVVSSG
jgi:GTPase SAR1 family protein